MSNLSTKYKAGATREELLDAGFRLLRDGGPSALRVRRVATEAKCSTMGVYTWFGDKDALVEAMWLDSFSRFGQALDTPSVVKLPLDRIRELMDTYREWALDHPAEYRLMFERVAQEYEPSPEARAHAVGTFQVLVEAVREAISAGDFPAGSAEEMAFPIWGLAHGLVSASIDDLGPVDVDAAKIYRSAVDALIVGLAAPKLIP